MNDGEAHHCDVADGDVRPGINLNRNRKPAPGNTHLHGPALTNARWEQRRQCWRRHRYREVLLVAQTALGFHTKTVIAWKSVDRDRPGKGNSGRSNSRRK